MMCDPVNKCANVGVDAGLVLLAAAVSPAHHTDNIVGPVALAHQRAARVPLQGRRGGFHQGSPPLFFYHHKKKQNHTLSLSLTNLAGIDAPIHVACTEHAVIQRVSVHVGGFTFLLGDQDDASIQQLVGTVLL